MALATGPIKVALEFLDAFTLKMVDALVDELVDAHTSIEQLEDENARLAERAITATLERDRAERRVAELELALQVASYRRWESHTISLGDTSSVHPFWD